MRPCRVYRYNQIPATVLGPPDLDKRNWDEDLYAKLEQLYRQAFDPTRYTLAGIEGQSYLSLPLDNGYPIQKPLRWDTPSTLRQWGQKYT